MPNSNDAHTPEPWALTTKLDGFALEIRNRNRDLILAWPAHGPPNNIDARRIVACVNACEGIPTETLERGRVYAPQGE